MDTQPRPLDWKHPAHETTPDITAPRVLECPVTENWDPPKGSVPGSVEGDDSEPRTNTLCLVKITQTNVNLTV